MRPSSTCSPDSACLLGASNSRQQSRSAAPTSTPFSRCSIRASCAGTRTGGSSCWPRRASTRSSNFDAGDDQDEIRSRHAHWYFALGAAAGRQDAEQATTLTRFRRDPGNVSLALAWARDHDIAAGLPLADSLFYPWLGAGRVAELRRWYERALADPGALSSSERAEALAGLGITLAYTDTHDPAREALTEALTLFREAGDERDEARVLMRLGGVEVFLRLARQDAQMVRAGAPDLRTS